MPRRKVVRVLTDTYVENPNYTGRAMYGKQPRPGYFTFKAQLECGHWYRTKNEQIRFANCQECKKTQEDREFDHYGNLQYDDKK